MTSFMEKKKILLLQIAGSYKNLQEAVVLAKQNCFQVLPKTKDLEETGWGSGDSVLCAVLVKSWGA